MSEQGIATGSDTTVQAHPEEKWASLLTDHSVSHGVQEVRLATVASYLEDMVEVCKAVTLLD